jgi:hypothetical protein
MEQQKQPLGFLFQSIAYNSQEDVEKFVEGLTLSQSFYVINQSLELAHSKGIFTLQESEILSKALRIFNSTYTNTE